MFKPKYTISDKVVNQLSEIAEIKALVSKSRLLPEREIFLRRAAAIKMAHTSTSIEGNTLKEYQVAQVAEGKKIPAPNDQIREVKNYLSALREIDKLAALKKEFDTKDILAVHKLVIKGLAEPEKVGVFRKGPVYIVNILPNKNEEVAYTPPKAAHVPKLIDNLTDWLAKSGEIHPIIRAGLFHYQFETIHPFTDGNGRTGRLLALLYLYQSGWDFKKILVLEDYYNRNRKVYYEALQTGKTFEERQQVDLTSWLEYYVEGFLDEAKRVKDQILSLSVVKDIQATRSILDKDELKIVDFVVTLGQITSSDVVDILEVPKRTAQAKLKRLEDIKVLVKKGSGPTTYYVIPNVGKDEITQR
jgi:Fic family protein